MAKPKTYRDAVEQANALVAEARLADPEEHFPYKLDEATAWLEAGAPAGPGAPGQLDGTDDTSRTPADYTSQQIIDASADYVEAQAAYLTHPNDDTRGDYESARDRLQAARLDHRQHRTGGFVIGAAARRV